MRRHFVLALLGVTFAAATAQAQDFHDMSREERRETIRNMSPEEREQFHKARREKWQSLSDAEKVRLIEERRRERREKMDARWEAMSDQEKIRFAEEKMKQRQERREHRREHRDR